MVSTTLASLSQWELRKRHLNPMGQRPSASNTGQRGKYSDWISACLPTRYALISWLKRHLSPKRHAPTSPCSSLGHSALGSFACLLSRFLF